MILQECRDSDRLRQSLPALVRTVDLADAHPDTVQEVAATLEALCHIPQHEGFADFDELRRERSHPPRGIICRERELTVDRLVLKCRGRV